MTEEKNSKESNSKETKAVISNKIIIKVTADFEGETILKFLRKQKSKVPFALVQKLVRKRVIRVNGKRPNKDYILQKGDEVMIPAISKEDIKPKKHVARVSESDIKNLFTKNIVFEDKNIIALNKPKGLATQGGTDVKISVDDILKKMSNEDQTYYLTHRLDKDTTGILLIAKNRQAAQELTRSFKERTIVKTYLALAKGKVMPMQGTINAPLARVKTLTSDRMVADDQYGKSSFTSYRVLEHFGKIATLLEVTPETGRKHQIRAHLSIIGHPIIGDGKYGGKEVFIEGLEPTIHLHAWKISHTEGYFKGEIEAPAPKSFSLSEIF